MIEAARSLSIPATLALLGAACLLALALLSDRTAPLPYEPPAPAPPWSGEPIIPIVDAPRLDRRKVALGETLFRDPRLSGRGDLPCSSCHDVATNGIHKGERRSRLDTPTIFNVGLSTRLGWQGKDRTLEAQALATLEAPMIAQGVSLATMIERLHADRRLDARFIEIYGHGPDQASVLDAIAVYERSLVTPGSRFDRWLLGNKGALSAQEVRGYETFKRLGCVACHQGQNIGGNMYQRHGIFRPLAASLPRILRVPSLRNVSETAPYFHDGSATTLDLAVRRMAGSQLNVSLSDEEAGDIVSFLKSLSGTYDGKPVRVSR